MVLPRVSETNVADLLKEKYQQLGKKDAWTTLLEVPPEKHLEINTEVLRIIINELKQRCIYVTLSKPFPELRKLFYSKKIDLKNLVFIDAISDMYGLKRVPTKNCVYVSGVPNIDSIIAELQKMLLKLNAEKKCVFLDSITTLLLYNSEFRTIKSSQFLIQTLKKRGANGVVVSTAGGTTTKRLVKKLSKFCDETIDFGLDEKCVKFKRD